MDNILHMVVHGAMVGHKSDPLELNGITHIRQVKYWGWLEPLQ